MSIRVMRPVRFAGKSIALLAIVLMTGCATIFSGTSENVTFSSEPSGARVYVDGIDRGQTPLTVPVGKTSSPIVTFRKDGYRDASTALNKKLDIMFILNIFNGFGFIVDLVTGAYNTIDPTIYNASLHQENERRRGGGGEPLESGIEVVDDDGKPAKTGNRLHAKLAPAK